MKKTLALMLALVMIISLCHPIIAYAEDAEGTAPVVVQEEPDPTEPVPSTEPVQPTGEPEPTDPPEPVWHEVRGTVVDMRSNPVAGAKVKLTAEGHDPVETASWEDGTFEVSVLESVPYRMTVNGGAPYEEFEFTVEAAEDLELGYVRLNDRMLLVSFEIANATAQYETESGNGDAESGGSLVLAYSSSLTVTAAPLDGCDLTVLDASNVSYNIEGTTLTIESLTAETTVRVLAEDVTAPAITGITVEPEGWAQSKTAVFTAEDNIPGQLRYYLSENEYDTASGAESFAESLSGPEYLFTENGTYWLYVLDEAGNMASQSFEVGGIDTEPPVISDLTPSTTNGTHAVAYTFTVSDNGELADVTWTAPNGTVEKVEAGEDGTYNITVTENGELYVTATDMAGNVTTINETLDNIDWNPPDIQIVTQSTWDAETNTAQIAVTDASRIVRVWVTDEDGAETELEAGENGYIFTATVNGAYTLHALDEADNEGTKEFVVDHIDTEAPVISHVEVVPEREWTATEIEFNVEGTDNQSGIKSLYYVIVDKTEDGDGEVPDISEWTKLDFTEDMYEFQIIVANDRNRQSKVYFIVEDGVGRMSEQSVFDIAIDISAPETVKVEFGREEEDGFFTSIVQALKDILIYRDYMMVRVDAHDNGSGVDHMEYQVVSDGEETVDDGWMPMEFPDEENHDNAEIKVENEDFIGYVYVRVYDAVGNCLEVAYDPDSEESFLVVLENTPETDDDRSPAPAVTAVKDNGNSYSEGSWTNRSVTVSAKAEAAVSGINRYEYQIVAHGKSVSESGWKTADPASVTISTDSNVDVYWRVVSNAENASKTAHMTVRVQKTAPSANNVWVDGKQGTNGWFVEYPTVAIVPPAQKPNAAPITNWFILREQGTEGTALTLGSDWPTFTKDGVYELLVWSTDAAGNKGSVDTTVVKVDTTAPTGLNIKADGTTILADDQSRVTYKYIYNRSVSVTADYNTNVSGTAKVEYQKVYDMSAYSPAGEWKSLPSGGLTVSPNDNCVIYLKVTDNAGNYTIVHSDGLIMDNTPPSGPNTSELEITVVGANSNGFFSGDATVDVKVIDPSVNNTYSGIEKISYQVICDGVETQNETVMVGENGTNIRQTGSETGNNGVVKRWTGSIKVLAGSNNSDNIVIRVTAADRAGNVKISETKAGALKIDTTAPTANLSYDNNKALYSDGKMYFDAERKLTVTVTERNLGEGKLTVTRNGEPYAAPLDWVKKTAGGNGDGNEYMASFTFTEDGVYTVSFDTTDLAGNKLSTLTWSTASIARTEFVIDKTAPKISVRYDNNAAKQEKYFDAPRTATVTVIDDSFDPAKFNVTVTAKLDGETFQAPKLGAWSHDGDRHTAKLVYEADGDYTFSCSCVDRAGNSSGSVDYANSSAPTAFTVDTVPVSVEVEGLKDSAAYKGKLEPVIRYGDVNMNSYTLKVTRTNMEKVDEDVTKLIVVSEENGVITLRFTEEENIDGIYKLKGTFIDMANHKTDIDLKFTVNRNGSVYEYSSDLLNLLNSYVYSADGQYTITEYNPSPVTARTVTITLDGTPLASPSWTMNDNREDGAQWYRYAYTINPENFQQDGKYRVTVASDDGAENRSEANPDIVFWRDTTHPELPLITGMEESIVNANEQTVKIQVYDTIGIANIKVEVTDNDGNVTVLLNEDLPEGETSVERSVVLKEGLRQHLRVTVTDRAGNKLDTDAEGFSPPYEFVDKITVSENFFTRWFADPWFFFGSIGGLAALGAGGATGVILVKRKKREKEAESESES